MGWGTLQSHLRACLPQASNLEQSSPSKIEREAENSLCLTPILVGSLTERNECSPDHQSAIRFCWHSKVSRAISCSPPASGEGYWPCLLLAQPCHLWVSIFCPELLLQLFLRWVYDNIMQSNVSVSACWVVTWKAGCTVTSSPQTLSS